MLVALSLSSLDFSQTPSRASQCNLFDFNNQTLKYTFSGSNTLGDTKGNGKLGISIFRHFRLAAIYCGGQGLIVYGRYLH